MYGTLVDIHTDEEQELLWEKLALFYGYYDAVYEPEELKSAFNSCVQTKEQSMMDADEGKNCEDRLKADAHEAFPRGLRERDYEGFD